MAICQGPLGPERAELVMKFEKRNTVFDFLLKNNI